jgi:CHASE3 domain sensor protein
MAIKGKRKPARRGGQARRRPVSAPRPVAAAQKPPWYRTTPGLVAAGTVVIVAVVVVLWVMANARSDAAELEDRQDALRTYTNSLSGVVQRLNGPVSEMAGAGQLSDEELTKSTRSWRKAFTSARTELSQLAPAAGAESTNRLVQSSLFLYGSTVEAFVLVADADEGRTKDRLQAQAGTQAAAATGVLTEAIALLDEARRDAEMSPSNLSPPGRVPPG